MVAFTLPDRRGLIRLVLAIGVIQILAYLFCARIASPGAHLAVPQPDTLLYCQSARQIVERMPFVFTPGDKPSTGCTSHLYPFVLAIPYALGAKGPAMVTTGFFLNAAFYLIFLFSWAVIIFHIVEDKWAQAAACVLVALGGQAAYSAMAQSDVGLFMAVSAAMFAALTAGRFWLFAVLLWLSPWCRPEGMMLILSYGGLLAWRRKYSDDKPARREWLALAVGLVSAVGVFALNYALTGYFQFTSVLFKTYFKQHPFHFAVYQTLQDTMLIAKELFLGMPYAMPRDLFFLPLIGTVFAWGAVFGRNWRGTGARRTLWFTVAAVMSLGSVAMSGWQNTNSDRYLAWLLPLWVVFVAEGAVLVGRLLPARRVQWLPFALAAAFQAVGAVAFVAIYLTASLSSQRDYDYALDAAAKLPPGASVGGIGCQLAYAWPGHRVAHLSGLYSLDFLSRDTVTALEVLKHEPANRFDFWTFYAMTDDPPTFAGIQVDALCGEKVALGVDNNFMQETRWGALDAALLPADTNIVTFIARSSLTLADRLDVGYPKDERRLGYNTGNRLHGLAYRPFGMVGVAGTNRLVEVGRAVVGWDEMTPQLTPERDVLVVMRTADRASVRVNGARNALQALSFNSPLRLRARLGAWDSGVFELSMDGASNRFAEVSFTIPGGAVTPTPQRLELYGDRPVFAYWFYQ